MSRNQSARGELARLSRRLMLKRTLSLGAVSLLSGCDLSGNLDSGDLFDRALRAMLALDDRVQAALRDELQARVWPLLDAGRCAPVIHGVFPLEQVGDAHRLMESSAHIGKIVLTL